MAPVPHSDSKVISTRVAMVMAVVAVLGAVAAFCAARAEQTSLNTERRLQQGKILELAEREEFLRKMTIRARYEERDSQQRADLEDLRKRASAVAENRGDQSALVRLQIQEELAINRSLIPLLRFFAVSLGNGPTLEDDLSKAAAVTLREYGFDVGWVEPAKGGGSRSIWERVDDRVASDHRKVLWLAGAVVLFVLALASFTFAQLMPARERRLGHVGYALGALALPIVLLADHSAWKTYLLGTACFGVLAPVGWAFARRFGIAPAGGHGEPPPFEVDPRVSPGLRMHFPAVADRLGRFTVAMIAITAVLSAASGFLYSWAATASSAAAGEALDHQTELFKSTARLGSALFHEVGVFATIREDRLRIQAARQRRDLADELPALLNGGDAADHLALWQRRLDDYYKTDKNAQETFDGPVGPDSDPGFPLQFVSGRLVPVTARAFALWDASSELSLKLQGHATVYLEMLTLFAVALYLFGQAVSMGSNRSSFILVFMSCSLVAIGLASFAVVGVSGLLEHQGAPRPECRAKDVPEQDVAHEAARHYGEGRMLFDTRRFAEAAIELQCAVDARPTFALAHYFLETATSLSATPQLDEGAFISLMSKESLGDITDHEKQALASLTDQGFLPPPSLQASYGFDSFLHALLQEDRNGIRRSIEATARAIALAPSDPVVQFNLGVALLADRQKAGALRAYDAGLALAVKDRGDIIGGAMTDLNTFTQYCPHLLDATFCKAIDTDIAQLKLKLLAGAWPSASNGPTSPGEVSNIRLAAEPAGLNWQATLPQVAASDTVIVIWYAYDSDWKVWRVLPAVSGPLRAKAVAASADFTSYLKATRRPSCVRDGDYRAEFYINGRLAGRSDPLSVAHGQFRPVAFGDLNLSMCYPQAWTSERRPNTLIRGYADSEKDATRGVLLFTFFNPGHESADETQRRSWFKALGAFTKEEITFRRIRRCAGYSGSVGDLLVESTNVPGTILGRVWIAPDGFVHVGLVFDRLLDSRGGIEQAPSRYAAGEDCATLVSITNLY
jgi:hypothetical protein